MSSLEVAKSSHPNLKLGELEERALLFKHNGGVRWCHSTESEREEAEERVDSYTSPRSIPMSDEAIKPSLSKECHFFSRQPKRAITKGVKSVWSTQPKHTTNVAALRRTHKRSAAKPLRGSRTGQTVP